MDNKGEIIIKASQAGDTVYAPAANVFQTFSVDCLLPIKVYELITSNEDGDNDYFYIENISFYPDNEISIYNRWGNIIFHSKDYKNDWNGKNIVDGTYFYTITIPSLDKTYKGCLFLSH